MSSFASRGPNNRAKFIWFRGDDETPRLNSPCQTPSVGVIVIFFRVSVRCVSPSNLVFGRSKEIAIQIVFIFTSIVINRAYVRYKCLVASWQYIYSILIAGWRSAA